MKIKLFIITGIIMLSGCAAGIVENIPKGNDDHFATIHIARKGGGWLGCWKSFLIQLDDQDFIRLDCGMKTTFVVPAGVTLKVSQVTSRIPDHIFLETKKGEEYYFGTDCNFGCCWFDELSLKEYRKMERTCEKVLKIEQ